MSSLNVVVSHGLSIIAHVVDYTCCHILHLWINVIAIIAGGLALQDVAVVEKQKAVSILLTE